MEAAKLGFRPDSVIQELGWDEDVDDALRASIEEQSGSALVDADYGDVVDGVILWWRDEDGDLAEGFMDTLQDLVENGTIWLLTPKVGRPGHVSGADIGEAAPIAGLSITTTNSLPGDWVVTKLSSHRR